MNSNNMDHPNLEFYVHDVKHTVRTADVDPDTTLNDYLRKNMGLTGTKVMCREGGCGVCIVAVTAKHPVTQQTETFAVNSCLVSIFSCSGWKISTAEGIGNRKSGFHPIQSKLAQFNGTQCGFCSSGMVMNMYALYQNPKLTASEVENSFGGNICRCTGYRPILAAFKSMAVDASVENIGIVNDIEEYPSCKRENCELTCTDICQKKSTIYHLKGSTKWYKVFSIKEIVEILNMYPTSQCKLVAGNTAQGVYRNFSKADICIDIAGVAELRTHQMNNNNLVLGAGVSLTETMNIFKTAAQNDANFSYLAKIADHIDLVAHVPVRNIGTVAGNLSIKHRYNEFPSDIFLCLETVGAMINIVDTNNRQTSLKPADYLKFDMNKKIMKSITLPALDSSYKYQSYKIMPRHQNAHALVNAGFLFKFKSNTIQSARIVFGAINPNFVHASESEQLLIGKNLFDNSVMQKLFSKLNEELKPDYVLPDPKPEFRKQLAIALTYKCILSMAPNVSEKNKSGGTILTRPLSKGTQDYGTNESLYPQGQPINKLEALAQVSGEAEYIVDIPDRPGQLYAAFVCANAPTLSEIKTIDTKAALALPGVVGFVDKTDIPGANSFIPPPTNFPENEELFCSGVVKHYFQPIGLILAKSQTIAEEGAALVKVTYTPPKDKLYFKIKDILKDNVKSKIFHEKTLVSSSFSDVEDGQVVKGELNINQQYHYHMETQTCVVVPKENDEYDVYPGTQWMDLCQTAGAAMLNITTNKINVQVRRLGGAFGAKISRNTMVSCAALVASAKYKKPVRLWVPFIENMNIVGKRNPNYCNFECTVNEKGVITDLKMNTYVDYGLHGNDSPLAMIQDLLTRTYDSSKFTIDMYSIRSDNCPSTWTRAPGSTEGLAMIEAVMEQAAYKLNMDPLDLRVANLNPSHPNLVKYINDLKEWANVDARKKEIADFNKANRWRKRGISVIPMAYGLTIEGTFNVLVSVYQGDGSVSISHGGIEMGQGINTKAVQVVAHRLGIPLEMVTCKVSNDLASPNTFTTGGSITSECVCTSLMKCCDEILARMKPVKDKIPLATWATIVKLSYAQQINLCSSQLFGSSTAKDYTIYGVAAAEVEVDILTGNHNINRVDLLEDVGDSLNPFVDIGQVEGAYIMGTGYYTSEEIIMDDRGEIKTNRTWNYKPPGFKDIPILFNVKFPKNNPNPESPLKTKATAEPPFCLTFGIPLAIRQAIKSARLDADPSADPWYPIDGPSTVENIFMNSMNDFKQYVL